MNLAIKLPDDLYERILFFPVLHAIQREWAQIIKEDEELSEAMPEEQELQLHLICLTTHIEVLNLLPMNAFYHELVEDDLSNVFSIHRAIKNLKITQKIDTYLCATKGFVDASIGKTLGANKCIGFLEKKNKIFFTEKVSPQEGRHKTEELFALSNVIWNGKGRLATAVTARDLETVFADYKDHPYLMINLSKDFESKFNKELIDFLGLFYNYKFVLLCDELEEDEAKQALVDYISLLSPKNQYFPLASTDWIHFGRLAAYCKGFLTHDSPLALLSAYCGGHTFWMNQQIDTSILGPNFFIGETRIFPCQNQTSSEINYGEIFDEIYDFISPIEAEGEEQE